MRFAVMFEVPSAANGILVATTDSGRIDVEGCSPEDPLVLAIGGRHLVPNQTEKSPLLLLLYCCPFDACGIYTHLVSRYRNAFSGV